MFTNGGFRFVVWLAIGSSIFALPPATVAHTHEQERKPTQNSGVDDTRMGAYRALAELSFEAFQKGDNAGAAKLARILERTWDRGESQERAVGRPNAALYNQIDDAMDAFVGAMIYCGSKNPDPDKVRAAHDRARPAYEEYLEKLKQADSLP